MDAFELFNENGKPAGVWCCGKCRKVRVLQLGPYGRMKEGEPLNTKEGAEACCRNPICPECGKEILDKTFRSTGMCSDCDSEYYREQREARHQERLAKATLVTDYEGPVYSENGPSGDYGDNYHSDVNHLVDALVDDLENNYCDSEGNFDIELMPEFAFCCSEELKLLDIGDAIERLCEDGYEDMGDRLDIPESLTAAVKEFNDKNAAALRCYNVDYTRKVALYPLVREALAEIKEACDRERAGP